MKLIEQGREHAINVIAHCAKAQGFYASGLPGGYEATWARDSMITSLGASLAGPVRNSPPQRPFGRASAGGVSNGAGSRFQTPFRKSLELLGKNQSSLGQIPNAVGDYNTERRSDVTYNSIDSTLWYLIGHHVYAQAYRDKALLRACKTNIEKAFLWLAYQDPNEDKLLVQQPTMDWEDAFPHKYGRVLNTQALHYAALNMHGRHELAEHIKKVVNGTIAKYLSLYDEGRGYYLPWIWKSHDNIREQEEWFDTLGNLLAIVTGLATPKIVERILAHIEKQGINKPFPCRAIHPPIKPKDKEWRSYFTQVEARPYHYLNGGVWPFIGGFYVASLVKAKQFAKAEQELDRLARANKLGKAREWEFNEWLDGVKGKPRGNPYQAWSAGMYLFAAECVKRKKVPFFS